MDNPIFLTSYEGREVLALDTGLKPQAFAQAKFGSLLSEHGAVFHADGSWEVWVPEGTLEHNGTVAIFGPAFKGKNLGFSIPGASCGEGASNTDSREAWQLYRHWLSLQSRIAEAEQRLDLSQSPMACLINQVSGEALILPAHSFQRAMITHGDLLESLESWVHPALSSERARVFTAALLAYRILTGTAPWVGTSGEEIRLRMREIRGLPARLAHPGLLPELTSLLDSALQGPDPKGGSNPLTRPSLEQFCETMLSQAWKESAALYRSPDEKELNQLVLERQKFERARDAKENRSSFFRKHTKSLLVASLAVIGLGLFIWDMARTSASRPSTRGLEAREVVQMYYASFTALDHESLEACLAKRAPKADVTAVMNFFVISKMRQGYERIIYENDPQPFIDQGLIPRGFIFGTVDVSIEELSLENESARYQVDYSLWFPGDPETPLPGLEPVGDQARSEKRRDILDLRFEKDRWLIHDIDRTLK